MCRLEEMPMCAKPGCHIFSLVNSSYCSLHLPAPLNANDLQPVYDFCLWYPGHVDKVLALDPDVNPFDTALCTAYIDFGFAHDLEPFAFRAFRVVQDTMKDFNIDPFESAYWWDIDNTTKRLQFVDVLRRKCLSLMSPIVI